jgi:hypothetical protein
VNGVPSGTSVDVPDDDDRLLPKAGVANADANAATTKARAMLIRASRIVGRRILPWRPAGVKLSHIDLARTWRHDHIAHG